ncbi:MAG: rhomboid family intramembrane serine protease [Opitutaceae bacterium]
MLPFHIETLYRHEPWANWIVLSVTAFTSAATQSGLLPADTVAQWFALGMGGPQSLAGHLFAHHGNVELVVELFFLWLYGNALCGVIGNVPFLASYLALGSLAGLAQLALGSGPVSGAHGAIAGLLGATLALFPANNVACYYPHWRGLRSVEVRVWTASSYWLAWVVAGALLHLRPAQLWGESFGLLAGLLLGGALSVTGFVHATEFDNGTLLEFCTGIAATRRRQAHADARAELRRLAQAYYEEYANLPAVSFGAPAGKRHRLTLRRSMEFARTGDAAAPSNAAHFGARRSAQPATRATAWPAALPDVRYFHFDGSQRHGPETRTAFLAQLAHHPDTTRWWYWAEGMREWRRAAELVDARAAAPVAPAIKTAAVARA